MSLLPDRRELPISEGRSFHSPSSTTRIGHYLNSITVISIKDRPGHAIHGSRQEISPFHVLDRHVRQLPLSEKLAGYEKKAGTF